MNRLASLALACAVIIFGGTAASAQQYFQPYPQHHGWRQASGTIAFVNGTHLQLRDGRNVFLKQGTVINPTGTRLSAGQRVFVVGTPGGNRAINATRIDVSGRGYYR